MSVGARVVAAEPIGEGGNSGASLERVTLDDGHVLIRKRVIAAHDWMARVGGDDGRIVAWWDAGLFDTITGVDHAIIDVERRDDGEWDVFMRDVSSALFPPTFVPDGAAREALLRGLKQMHTLPVPEGVASCPLATRYEMFAPDTMEAERARGNHHGEIIGRGWEVFSDELPRGLGDAVIAAAREPRALVAALEQFAPSLVHGDFRLGNLGHDADGPILIDWGERVGVAPAAVDLAWLIGFDGYHLAASHDAFLNEIAEVYGDALTAGSLNIALAGALVQLGGIIGLWIANARDDADRELYRDHLTWLAARAALFFA